MGGGVAFGIPGAGDGEAGDAEGVGTVPGRGEGDDVGAGDVGAGGVCADVAAYSARTAMRIASGGALLRNLRFGMTNCRGQKRLVADAWE